MTTIRQLPIRSDNPQDNYLKYLKLSKNPLSRDEVIEESVKRFIKHDDIDSYSDDDDGWVRGIVEEVISVDGILYHNIPHSWSVDDLNEFPRADWNDYSDYITRISSEVSRELSRIKSNPQDDYLNNLKLSDKLLSRDEVIEECIKRCDNLNVDIDSDFRRVMEILKEVVISDNTLHHIIPYKWNELFPTKYWDDYNSYIGRIYNEVCFSE